MLKKRWKVSSSMWPFGNRNQGKGKTLDELLGEKKITPGKPDDLSNYDLLSIRGSGDSISSAELRLVDNAFGKGAKYLDEVLEVDSSGAYVAGKRIKHHTLSATGYIPKK